MGVTSGGPAPEREAVIESESKQGSSWKMLQEYGPLCFVFFVRMTTGDREAVAGGILPPHGGKCWETDWTQLPEP